MTNDSDRAAMERDLKQCPGFSPTRTNVEGDEWHRQHSEAAKWLIERGWTRQPEGCVDVDKLINELILIHDKPPYTIPGWNEALDSAIVRIRALAQDEK